MITLWTTVQAFIASLMKHNAKTLRKDDQIIVQQYASIKNLAVLINHILGPMVMYGLIEMGIVYAVNISNFFKTWTGLVYTCGFTFVCVVILLRSAQIVEMVGESAAK